VTAGGLLNAAFELYRRQARGAWTIVALIVIPAQILVWVMVRTSLSRNAYARAGTVHTGSVALPTVAIALLGFLSAILAIGALSRLFVEAYTGHRANWEESLAYASSNLVPLLGLAIVSGVLLVLGYTFFLVPGIFLTVAWSAAVPALMFERARPLQALGRSLELVRGNWWRTFGALLVALIIIVGFSFLVDTILGGAQSSSNIDVILVLAGISRAVGAIFTYPLLAALTVVIYAHLRAQKEGVSPESLMPRPTVA
jgi:hypothetical protein